MVSPGETSEDIEKRLTHSGIRGLKCYHQLGDGGKTFEKSIEQYLPESAWEVANKHKICITLHLAKSRALADKDNLRYIKTMTKKYPDAAWTAIATVTEVAHLENVWFDFSAVCEPSAMFQIIKKAGVERCMWGSDYPVCCPRGKCISIGDSFYWIYQQDIDNFDSKTQFTTWTIAVENLMATRLACIMADLHESQIEDLFYNNAARLFDGK
ncbi:MAG: amidohydrolase family protein [Clostridia bacterium]|nr:amidohydrolase family protein [Clostridia bacterium]